MSKKHAPFLQAVVHRSATVSSFLHTNRTRRSFFCPSLNPYEKLRSQKLSVMPSALATEQVLEEEGKVHVVNPFDRELKSKPNVIVYPTRRVDLNFEDDSKGVQKRFSEKSGKLSSSKSIKSNGTLEKKGKPLFITTVKKGEFLEPPPEIANLLGLKVGDGERKASRRMYAYVSKPKVVQKRSVCTEENDLEFKGQRGLMDAPLPYVNVMYDRRIVRGSNYAQCPMQTGDGESAAARAAEARRRALARRKAQKQKIRGMDLRIGSPPAVRGRTHERVQTEAYLEELWVHPEVNDTCTQTDLFLERPVSPLYVPAKIGIDAETQIYPGDLFDFDMEVQPILEVLVGKTIEQALIEVLEEEELAALREQQRRFLEIRAAETAEAQRMAEKERRMVAEKERNIASYERGLQVQKEMEERIAASVLIQGYMADLLPSVLEGLEEEGFLADNIKQDIDESFMPWLIKEVTHEMQEMVSSRDVLTDMVREILENRAEIYKVLNRTPRDESDHEECDIVQDISLTEHVKLKKEIGMQK